MSLRMGRGKGPDKDDVRARARGHWDRILMALFPQLEPTLANPRRHIACPVHGGKNGDAFRVFPNYRDTGAGVCNTCGHQSSGFGLIMWITGWDFDQMLREVDAILGGGRGAIAPVRMVEAEQPSAEKDRQRRTSMQRVWNESVPLGHPDSTLAFRYFENRGLFPLRGPLSEVRFHRSLAYYDGPNKKLGEFPAIVALIRLADGTPGSLHRIYLGQDGRKANVPAPKKTMMVPSDVNLAGGAVWLELADPGVLLNVAEGLETSLAVRIITGNRPTWACLQAGQLASLQPPPQSRVVCVWADPGEAGLRAGNTLVARMRAEGRRAVLVPPPVTNDDDWNDVLMHRGADGVRSLRFFSLVQRGIEEALKECGVSPRAGVASCG